MALSAALLAAIVIAAHLMFEIVRVLAVAGALACLVLMYWAITGGLEDPRD